MPVPAGAQHPWPHPGTTGHEAATTLPADRRRPSAATIERHSLNASTPGTRRPRPARPWGLIAVSAGFLAAAASVIAVGLISLGLTPVLQ